jgi:3-oxoadipate enol-lactonase
MSAVNMIRIGSKPSIAVDYAGEGPLVLFLHGVGGNRTNWRVQLPVFAERFTAAAWDARGYLGSDAPPKQLDMADFSSDVARVIAHFGARMVHLVGLSMGGTIALDFYFRYPSNVASLVLCDTSPSMRTSRTPAEIEAFLAVREKPLREGKTMRDIAPGIARSLLGSAAGPEVYQQLVESLESLRPKSYLAALAAIAKYEPIGDLETISVPCLILCGSEDRLISPEISRKMHAKIPRSRLCILEGAGHLSNIEKPAEFNDAILAFLASI